MKRRLHDRNLWVAAGSGGGVSNAARVSLTRAERSDTGIAVPANFRSSHRRKTAAKGLRNGSGGAVRRRAAPSNSSVVR